MLKRKEDTSKVSLYRLTSGSLCEQNMASTYRESINSKVQIGKKGPCYSG